MPESMRHRFANFLHLQMKHCPTVMLLTADLGYGLWDKIKADFPDRF